MKKIYISSFIINKMKKRADEMFQRIRPFLKDSKTVIDVGCGNCFIANNIQKAGKKITAVDIRDQSLEQSIKVKVFDGIQLPFKDKYFDTGLLLTVMHHTPFPEKIFQEVARVSKAIIVIETSYRNIFEKIFIVLFDSFLNLQPKFYWNSYRSNSEWRNFFDLLGYQIVQSKNYIDMQIAPYFHPLYYLVQKK